VLHPVPENVDAEHQGRCYRQPDRQGRNDKNEGQGDQSLRWELLVEKEHQCTEDIANRADDQPDHHTSLQVIRCVPVAHITFLQNVAHHARRGSDVAWVGWLAIEFLVFKNFRSLLPICDALAVRDNRELLAVPDELSDHAVVARCEKSYNRPTICQIPQKQ